MDWQLMVRGLNLGHVLPSKTFGRLFARLCLEPLNLRPVALRKYVILYSK